MMKLYLIFSKKGLAVILALSILALILLGQFSTVNLGFYDGSTHQKRMEFIRLAGIKVNENAVSVKNSRIPDEITGVTAEYNLIQQKSGFNLSNFRGKNITVYSYATADYYEKTVNLIVYKGKIIAGDITDNLNGSVAPILKEK